MPNLNFFISHRTSRHLALSTLHVKLKDAEEESCEYLQLVRSAQTCVLTVISGALAPSNLCRSAIIGVLLPICGNSCSKCWDILNIYGSLELLIHLYPVSWRSLVENLHFDVNTNSHPMCPTWAVSEVVNCCKLQQQLGLCLNSCLQLIRPRDVARDGSDLRFVFICSIYKLSPLVWIILDNTCKGDKSSQGRIPKRHYQRKINSLATTN